MWTSKTDLSWAHSLPQRVEGLPPLLKVACGNSFLVAEAEDSGLWVLGTNSNGQLGLGHTNSTLQPTLVQVEERSGGTLRCLAALHEGVMIIDSQGGVFSTGNNSHGQLGRSSGDLKKFQRIMNIPPMLGVSCGYYHTLSLDENGGVWTWGYGGYGQLGTGNTSNQSQPALVPSLKGMSALVAGRYHSLAFPQEGGLLVFGYNSNGELGLNHTTSPIAVPTQSSVRPALPRIGAVQKAFEWRKKSVWDTAKELFESQSGWNEADILAAMTEKELQNYREDFQTGLVSGSTPAADWQRFHTSAQRQLATLQQEKDSQVALLAQEEEKRAGLDQELEQALSQVTRLKEELAHTSTTIQTTQAAHEITKKHFDVVLSFEPLLRTAAEAASTFYSEMKAKLTPFRPDELTCSDLGFALNLFGVSNALRIAETLEKEVSMAFLGVVTREDLKDLKMSQVMERQRILLALHTLTNGLILDDAHVDACAICQNQTPEDTVAYLEECRIALPKERVLELKANASHLILMDKPTLQSTFSLERMPAMLIQKRLKQLKAEHLQHLK